MGWELHITRAEYFADNEQNQIGSDEWLQVVAEDDELNINGVNGEYRAVWSGNCTLSEPWLDWFNGNISTKNPDRALLSKMLKIAGRLSAHIVDDDNRPYTTPDDLDNPPWADDSANTERTLFSGLKKFFQRK